MRRAWALVIVLAACGRSGFDLVGSSDAQRDTDAARSADATDATGVSTDDAPECSECGLGPTFVGSSSGAADGASVSFAHSVPAGANRILLVGSHVASKTYTTIAVSYAGMPLTQVNASISANTIAQDCSSTLWYMVAPPEGSATVIATLEASTRPMAAWAMSFTGVEQLAPIASSMWTVGSTATTTAAVSIASAPGELVVDNYCMAITPPGPLSPGPSQTERVRQDDTSNEMRIAGSTQPGTGNVTMAWTFDPAYYTLRAAVLRPAPP